MRPTPCSSGRQGRIAKVDGSGIAIMSDSSIALKPVIDEPSKPMPPSKASASSDAPIENDLSCPRMSVNQNRMNRIWRSSTRAMTSSEVRGWSLIRGTLADGSWTAGPVALDSRAVSDLELLAVVQPAPGPHSQLRHGRLEPPAHRRQLVGDLDGRGGLDRALDDAARLELLHALGQEAVAEFRDRGSDLGEAHGATIQEDLHDRSRPAAPDQLNRLVIKRAAGGLLAHGHERTAPGFLRGLELPCFLDGSVGRHLAGDVDPGREGLERGVRDGLEDLLVVPARLARLLVEVHRRCAGLRHDSLEVAQQHRLVLVARVPLARQRDVVELEARRTRRARVQGQTRLGVEVVGDGERDPLERPDLQTPVAQLGTEPGVCAQHRGRARDHAEEVGELAARGQRATKDRHRALGRGEVVVDLESAHGCLHLLCLRTGVGASMPRYFTKGALLTLCKYIRPSRSEFVRPGDIVPIYAGNASADLKTRRNLARRRYGCAVVSATMQQKTPSRTAHMAIRSGRGPRRSSGERGGRRRSTSTRRSDE